MADMRVFAKQNSVGRNPNSTVGWRGTSDGSGIVVPWVTALALEGRVFQANIGSASTPVSFAKTAYDSDQPQLVVDVPSGTSILPLKIELHLEDSAGTDNEIMATVSTTIVGAGTSTAVTQKNQRSDSPITSGCSVYSLYTGNGTDPTVHTEIWRSGYAFADSTTNPRPVFTYDVEEHPRVVIVGAGALVIYIVGTTTAPAGYLKVVWAELPSATAITA
jgi:hypothetical protein